MYITTSFLSWNGEKRSEIQKNHQGQFVPLKLFLGKWWHPYPQASSISHPSPTKVLTSFMGSPLLNVLITNICFGIKLKKKVEKSFFQVQKNNIMMKRLDMHTVILSYRTLKIMVPLQFCLSVFLGLHRNPINKKNFLIPARDFLS